MAGYKHGTHKSQKGYPRISAGPLRGKYIHRIVAEAMLRRPLGKDEDVHHKDGNKLNCHPSNLQVIGHAEHGAVSARQHWFLQQKEKKEKEQWNDYFDSEQKHVCATKT